METTVKVKLTEQEVNRILEKLESCRNLCRLIDCDDELQCICCPLCDKTESLNTVIAETMAFIRKAGTEGV